MATKEINKFEAQITASDTSIMGARASIMSKGAKRAAENKVRLLEDKVDSLKTTILNLSDLAPETTYSLRPGGKDFDAKGWFDKMYEAQLELELKEIELTTAVKLKETWFGK